MNKVDTVKAKASWGNAGLNAQGTAAVNAWIDKLAANIEANPGRWSAYAKMAYYESDPMGSVKMLKDAMDLTSK